MIQDLVETYDRLRNAVYAGTATDEDCETLQDVSLLLQMKGVTV